MKNFTSYLWWLASTVVFALVSLELASWVLLEFTGRPEFTYQAKYMNEYRYHPYMAFHSVPYPEIFGEGAQIVILGGSTASGVGPAERKDAFFNVMKKRLADLGRPIQVANYAVPGLVSSQEHAAYKSFIYPGPAPSVVLALTGFNDMYFYLFRTIPVGGHEFSYAFDKLFRSGYPDHPALRERLRNFARRSSIYGVFHGLVFGLKQPVQLSSYFLDPTYAGYVGDVPQEVIAKAAKNFLINAEATGLMAKSRGTKFLLVLQPVVYYGGEIERKPNLWFKETSAQEEWVNSVGERRVAYDQFYEIVIEGLNKLKKAGILDFLDYRGFVSGPKYLDPVHFNEEASRELGESIAIEVRRLL